MTETLFKPGTLAKHVHFKYVELFIIKVLENGDVACRYRSYHSNDKATSEFILHYAEFDPIELVPYEPKKGLNISGL